MEIQSELKSVRFSIFSPEMIRKMSAAKIIVPDTYDDDGYPIDSGLVDTRLGVVDPGLKCKTCGGRLKECPGHFGHIELVRPVIHVEFVKQIFHVLKSTCPNCHRLLSAEVRPIAQVEEKEEAEEKGAKPEEKVVAKTAFEVPSILDEEPKEKSKNEVAKEEKKKSGAAGEKQERAKSCCLHCGEKLAEIKILKPTTFLKDGEPMLQSDVREWLGSLNDADIRALGFDPIYSRPEWMVITVLLVPPVNVRPSITLETGERSEDDLTHKLVDIIRINQKLEANINAGAPQLIIEDLWELLQYHVTTYFDNETANIPPARHRSGRALKTLAQRLKGKEGRFRYNLSGKRVNFSARTVVSPDPRISLNEVGVPYAIAEEMSVPVAVSEWNIERMKQYILADKYPKALYVIRSDGKRIKVVDSPDIKKEIADNLKVGWIVERQIVEKDVSIFNRQPSLHRISMMCHLVKLLGGKTFRINPLVCPPYNADFDGDEMNLHIIQTEEAQAEALELMKVERQILSPRHGHAIIKPQEDHISGYYFLTQDEMDFTKEEIANLLYLVGITEMPKPDRKQNRYSGKSLFSLLLPQSISLKIKSKMGEEIVVSKGKLLKGALDSNAMSGELLEKIFISEGPEFTAVFLDNSTRLALEAISIHGLSVSLADYSVSEKARKKIDELLNKMNREIDNLIMQYKNKSLERSPGMSLKDTLEAILVQITSQTRETVGKVVEEDLTLRNPSIIMAKIGARGSLLNAIQMSSTVAQQTVRNKRPSRGYRQRTLPYFKPSLLTGKERGFVYSSFVKGLSVHEFFHHAMGGREALVNTAIRTARSGYMQRRLINALQDLVVYEDGTVRNADLSIVQFIYGGDAKDPMLASKTEIDVAAKQDDIDTA